MVLFYHLKMKMNLLRYGYKRSYTKNFKRITKKWSRAKLYTNKGNPSGRKHKTRRRN